MEILIKIKIKMQIKIINKVVQEEISLIVISIRHSLNIMMRRKIRGKSRKYRINRD